MHAWLAAMAVALLATGCSTVQSGPSAETKAALAPTGKLRVGFLAVPLYAAKDASGQFRGPAVDLGEALAARLGVPMEPVPQPSVPALLAAAKSGACDVVFTGINAERAALVDFSSPYMQVEQGILVRPGSTVTRIDDIDRAGMRVGVLEKAGADVALTKRLKSTQIVRLPNIDQLFAQFASGQLDMVAGTTSRLLDEVAKVPGSRVLEGSIVVEPLGVGVPKGRNPEAARFVDTFVRSAKADGLVARAIAQARLVGVSVAAAD